MSSPPPAPLDDVPMRKMADETPHVLTVAPAAPPKATTVIFSSKATDMETRKEFPAIPTSHDVLEESVASPTTPSTPGAPEIDNSGGPNDPNRILRWQIIPFMCLFLFGTDYCFDMPGSLGAGEGLTIQTHFAANGKEYTQKMNQSLYAVYSYPNMVMTLVGGLLIDKYLGLRKTVLLMSGVVVVSSFIFSFGIAVCSYPIIVLGRFLFGLCGETLFVAQGAFLARWFGGTKFLSLVFGIAVSSSRLGGGMSYMISPSVAAYGGVVLASLVGAFFNVLSFLCCLIVVVVDRRREAAGLLVISAAKKHKVQQKRRRLLKKSLSEGSLALTPSKPLPDGTFPPAGGSASTIDPASPVTPQSPNVASFEGAAAAGSVSFQLSFLGTLPKSLWFLSISAMLCYGATFPFVGIAKTYFERSYAMDSASASFSAGLFHIFGSVLCPFMGAVVDRTGRSPVWLMISATGLITVFSTFLMLPGVISPPSVVVFFMSLFYSFFVASLWSFSSHTVPASAGGFGFGVMSAAVNFGLATSPLCTGTILDAYTDRSGGVGGDREILPSSEGFHYALMYLLFIVGCALVNSFILWQVDIGNLLNAGVGDGWGILMAKPSDRPALKKDRDEALEALWADKVNSKLGIGPAAVVSAQ